MKLLLTLLVLALAAGGAALVWRARSPEEIPAERIVEPRRGDIVDGVLAIGRVEPRTRVELKSKANGLIQKLHVDVGDPVRVGQVLAELDKEILAARVEEADGKLRQANAERDLARGDLERIERERSNPEIAFAARDWERVRKLFADGVASVDERDAAEERHEKARYELGLLDAYEKLALARVAAAEGRIKEIQATANLARQELQEATIVSPIDGVVLYRYLEEGDAVSSIRVAGGTATTIMTLGDLSELYVDGEVDEVDVGRIISEQRIREDLIARVKVESFKDRQFLGRVARITPLGLEDMNGIVTFEVRITLQNPEKLLLANMTANSLIVIEERKDVLLVSQGALVRDAGQPYALIYDEASGRSERRPVKVGLSDGAQVEVLDGISTGERIVIP